MKYIALALAIGLSTPALAGDDPIDSYQRGWAHGYNLVNPNERVPTSPRMWRPPSFYNGDDLLEDDFQRGERDGVQRGIEDDAD